MDDKVTHALEPVAEQLRADGYLLEHELADDDVLDCAVVAGPDACEECLVPKDLMGAMIADQLQSAGVAVAGVRLRYPVES